jgi:biopolymer transport protein ExbD
VRVRAGGVRVRAGTTEVSFRAAQTARNPPQIDRPVAVRADKTLKYGEVVEVLDWCRAAGFADVRLATARAAQAR